MRRGPLAPSAHEVVVQTGTDQGAGDRDEAASPLLHHFPAGFGGDALNHFRDEAVDDFFFQQFAADVDSGGAGGGDPEVGHFFFGVEFESVDEAEFLDGADGDGGEETKVGNNCEQASEAESGALDGGHFGAAAKDGVGDFVEAGGLEHVHALKAGNGQAVGGAQLDEKFVRVDFYGFVGVGEAADEALLDAAAEPGFVGGGHGGWMRLLGRLEVLSYRRCWLRAKSWSSCDGQLYRSRESPPSKAWTGHPVRRYIL